MYTIYDEMMHAPKMMQALRCSSVSDADAGLRADNYAKLFSRNEEMKEAFMAPSSSIQQKMFSGYSETPLLSTQYFNATVASYLSSFAGYMSVERDFDQPNGIFYWFDVLGVSDLRTVIPNLGPDNYQDIQTMGGFTVDVEPNTSNPSYVTVTGRKILAGTVRVKIETATKKVELVDNAQGVFMAVASTIESGSINYLNGKITFTLASDLASAVTKIQVVGKEDTTGTPSNTIGASNAHQNDKRFMAKQMPLGLQTVPDMLVAEYNIAALGAMKKATGADMATFLFTRLRELYTKCINARLINTLQDGYKGIVLNDLDLSNNPTSLAGRFYDYRSRVDLFDSYLINIESALATKAVKGVKVTAYVAGNQACNIFQKGSMIGKFEKNTKMTYINDLLGWYDGIPVLRSTDVKEEAGEGTIFALHKTDDGQMAPLARGIYMPLTDTPTVGNYNNPTQMASGIYYQEGVKYMAQELVQKVTFKYGF